MSSGTRRNTNIAYDCGQKNLRHIKKRLESDKEKVRRCQQAQYRERCGKTAEQNRAILTEILVKKSMIL